MAGGVKKRLGAQVARSRRAAKLTQEVLARRVNVRMETISRLERGVSIPDLDVIERIALELGTPLESLFQGDGKQGKPSKALARLAAYLNSKNDAEVAMIHDVARRIFEARGPGPRNKK